MKYLWSIFIYFLAISFFGCGTPDKPESDPKNEQYKKLTQEEKDYIERFNVVAKDIKGFPPSGKDIEKYFYIFKSVPKLEDAKFFIFGEVHTHAANRLWSAGAINRMVREGDVVLFEGDQGGTIVKDVAEHITTGIFAAREYEKLKSHKTYKPTAISKIKNNYFSLFFRSKSFLALDILNLGKGQGYYWDLVLGDGLHPDLKKRNEEQVQTMKDKLPPNNRIFVITGALHTPHYEFAYTIKTHEELGAQFPAFSKMPAFLATPGAKKDEINQTFYQYFSAIPSPIQASTKPIFEFLKDKDFAVLIPKNLPDAKRYEPFFPKNAR